MIFLLLRNHDENVGLTIHEIHSYLENQGIYVDTNTIRRDITSLSTTHGLVCSESKPVRYWSSKDFQIKHELRLDDDTLQVLIIALNNLRKISHEYFNDYAAKAEATILNSLDAKTGEELIRSKNKYFFDYSSSGRPQGENTKDFQKVMKAIRENKIITCKNESPYKDNEHNIRIRKFAPLMFLLSSGVPYFLVEDLEDRKIKKLRATRVTCVKISKIMHQSSFNSENLKTNSLIGGWGGIEENSIDIKIICDKVMATFFKEKKIHSSQKVKNLNEDTFEVTLACSHSSEIVRLISSFGGHVKSIEPSELYSEVKDIWENGLQNVA
ncbi:helix-turn-helix transcriptional regulator [Bacteriovorax sp. BSW11_IV]|uniref:helix-turn-helix transcriptional regulator n=1 Tax=Bacteriovorax sp. BSW11_IV TaxID=1353529 RepID=UPI0018CBD8C0|nr:WYL domain-containing protein [Bacteriovorax sp. BSW11_IV]